MIIGTHFKLFPFGRDLTNSILSSWRYFERILHSKKEETKSSSQSYTGLVKNILFSSTKKTIVSHDFSLSISLSLSLALVHPRMQMRVCRD
jgi:hypothetical protein